MGTGYREQTLRRHLLPKQLGWAIFKCLFHNTTLKIPPFFNLSENKGLLKHSFPSFFVLFLLLNSLKSSIFSRILWLFPAPPQSCQTWLFKHYTRAYGNVPVGRILYSSIKKASFKKQTPIHSKCTNGKLNINNSNILIINSSNENK